MKAINIRVKGRVQGVYFRANTCGKAKELSINGTVKNLNDGTVEILAEGEEEQLNKLVKWCHQGPLLAHVTSVDVTEITLTGFKNFETIRS